MVDETTDITNKSQLDFHLRLICDGVDVQTLPITTSDELIKAVTGWCKARKVNLRKVNLGTDGARAFTGRHKGVACIG